MLDTAPAECFQFAKVCLGQGIDCLMALNIDLHTILVLFHHFCSSIQDWICGSVLIGESHAEAGFTLLEAHL